MAASAKNQPEYGDVATYDTFPKVLAYNARNWPDEVAMREKEFGIWNAFTWAQYHNRVRLMALGDIALKSVCAAPDAESAESGESPSRRCKRSGDRCAPSSSSTAPAPSP